jgi:hypothetical protein
MTRNRNRITVANPLIVWTRLAVKSNEMLLASAHVIGHRTSRIALAGPIPHARDRREFHLMGQEKLEAAAESMQAVSLRILTAHQQLCTILFRQFVAGASGLMSLAIAPASVWPSRRQAELVRDSLANSAAVASHLSGAVAHLAHHGLKPVHSRATSNAKRLLKR